MNLRAAAVAERFLIHYPAVSSQRRIGISATEVMYRVIADRLTEGCENPYCPGDQDAACDAVAVATFVPAHADICRFLKLETAFDVRNILIDMIPNNDLRIRNAWVRGSNPLCGTDLQSMWRRPSGPRIRRA